METISLYGKYVLALLVCQDMRSEYPFLLPYSWDELLLAKANICYEARSYENDSKSDNGTEGEWSLQTVRYSSALVDFVRNVWKGLLLFSYNSDAITRRFADGVLLYFCNNFRSIITSPE